MLNKEFNTVSINVLILLVGYGMEKSLVLGHLLERLVYSLKSGGSSFSTPSVCLSWRNGDQ